MIGFSAYFIILREKDYQYMLEDVKKKKKKKKKKKSLVREV
jgi:hypothetical protein